MIKYKFTCKDAVDFLYKCKYAKAKDGRLKSGRYKDWFKPGWDLTGPCSIWTVDDYGMLSCYGLSYANDFLQDVPDITNIEINLGGL